MINIEVNIKLILGVIAKLGNIVPHKFYLMPKRSSDEYIQLKRKVTNKVAIKLVRILEKEWSLEPQKVCYRIFEDAINQEINKRKVTA